MDTFKGTHLPSHLYIGDVLCSPDRSSSAGFWNSAISVFETASQYKERKLIDCLKSHIIFISSLWEAFSNLNLDIGFSIDGERSWKPIFALSQEESSFCLAMSGDKRGLSLWGQHTRLCQGLCFSPDLYPPPRRVWDYGEMSLLALFWGSETHIMLSSANAETCQGMSKSGQLPWGWSRSINKGRNGLCDSHVSSHVIKYHPWLCSFKQTPLPKVANRKNLWVFFKS